VDNKIHIFHSVDELKWRLIDVWCGLEQSVFDKTIDQSPVARKFSTSLMVKLS